MRCPKCFGGTLERLELAGIEVDRCAQCQGVWLDEYELDDLLDLDPTELQALLDAPRAAGSLDDQPASCPRDGAALRRLRQRTVVLDCCPQCKGLWLDAGEFRRLRGG